jgi:hypothetical protein
MVNKIVHTTSTEKSRAVYVPSPVNERTCFNCGTGEKVQRRWRNAFGLWVRLECTHVQSDDEY